MSQIRVMTDSASDISVADEKKYGISMLPFQVTLGGKSYLSRVDLDNEQFYRLMDQIPELPSTSQITPFQFQEIYLREAENGTEDLILVLINSKGSSTYENACLAAEQFRQEHPERGMNIHCIDGMGYNGIYGGPVIEAAKLRDRGASAQEIVTYLRDILPRREIYFGIYMLKYAARSGRIPTAAAFLGDKLGLKPVMRIFDQEITTAAKCRGEKHLIERLADLSVEDMVPGSPYEIIYGCDETCRDEMEKAMVARVGYGPVNYFQIGAAVAANAGPKVAGVSFTKK